MIVVKSYVFSGRRGVRYYAALLTLVMLPLNGQTPFSRAFELLKSPDPTIVRKGEVQIMTEFKNHPLDWSSDSMYLVDQLSSSSDYIRQQAAGLIATLEMLIPTFTLDPRSEQNVYQLLNDPIERLRITAIRILGYSTLPKPGLTNDQATQVINLLSDGSLKVRQLVIEAVLNEKPLREETVRTVVGRYHMDAEVQETIIETIGRAKIDTQPSALLLSRLLEEKSGESLIPVLNAIGQIGGLTGQVTLQSVRQLSETSDQASVKKAATEALRRFQNAPIPPA